MGVRFGAAASAFSIPSSALVGRGACTVPLSAVDVLDDDGKVASIGVHALASKRCTLRRRCGGSDLGSTADLPRTRWHLAVRETSSSRLKRFVLIFSGKDRNQDASSSDTASSSKRTRNSLGSCGRALGLSECRPPEVEGRVSRRSEVEVDDSQAPSLTCCFLRPWTADCWAIHSRSLDEKYFFLYPSRQYGGQGERDESAMPSGWKEERCSIFEFHRRYSGVPAAFTWARAKVLIDHRSADVRKKCVELGDGRGEVCSTCSGHRWRGGWRGGGGLTGWRQVEQHTPRARSCPASSRGRPASAGVWRWSAGRRSCSNGLRPSRLNDEVRERSLHYEKS